ncbi:hypothetical protein DH2020_042288 [Rehmannia glutinosa]|uniref:Bromo domain-containing protein n=1 Tax=Rehmannia glutinosa TaxID=99300 RepID=A0ABR0UND5_REHGL
MAMVAENQAKIRTSLHMQFPTMSTEDNTAQRNLKFKITTKGIRKDSEYKSRDNTVKLLENKGQRDRVTGSGNKLSEVKVLAKPSMPMKSCKRKPEESLDGQRGKKRKMDRNLQLQCGNILKELMNHQAGWIFNEPVDPVKWNIPDYFSIITEPMDLGTIKRKLAGNMYFGAEEFAADVKLTFSNAMTYNVPGHEVHEFAKEMNGNFCRRWKSLEAKLQHKNTNVEKAFFVHHMDGRATKQTVENNQDRKPTVLKKAPLRKVKPSLRNTVQKGPGVVFDEEKSPHLSTPATTSSSVEGWTSFSVQMSPKKALRAAMLKSRFADTIFKATHQVEKSDPLRMQQEKERLEREKQEGTSFDWTYKFAFVFNLINYID